MTCADLARIRLTAGDPEGASEALRPVFRLAPDRRLVGVARRMSDLRARLADARFGGSAIAVNLAEQIEQFSTDLVALAGGQS